MKLVSQGGDKLQTEIVEFEFEFELSLRPVCWGCGSGAW